MIVKSKQSKDYINRKEHLKQNDEERTKERKNERKKN